MKKKKKTLDNDTVNKLIVEYNKKKNDLLKQYFNLFDREFDIFNISKNIIDNNSKIWCPPIDVKLKNIKINSWFTIKESKEIENNDIDCDFEFDKLEDCDTIAKKVILKLTNQQKNIINKWLEGYRKLYNEALRKIKSNVGLPLFTLDWKKMRSQLKNEKEEIVKESGIKVHDVDYSIKLACQNYKSAYSNYKKGYIKHFRIRYWGKGKQCKIMDLEKSNFKSGSIRKDKLGIVKGYYNGKEFNFKEIQHDCRLKYDGIKKEYYLFVPEKVICTEINKRGKIISIDPGVRVFGTGITENKVVEIGKESSERIKKYMNKKDKATKNEKIPDNKKKKIEKECNKKIKNLVNELHWKSINYLTKNYDVILIGNMSPKGIIRKGGNLNKMTKRMVSALSFYNFRERLKYKCKIRDTKYKMVNEYYTSKMCSKCGRINKELGSSEIFKCEKCNLKIGRDYNGCRGIYLKNFI